jgi:replicative DNA helicase
MSWPTDTETMLNSSGPWPNVPCSNDLKPPYWPSPLRAVVTPRQPRWERVDEVLERVVANIEARTAIPALPFGIAPLDKLTCGLVRGKVTVLAARSSHGKTSLALQTAWSLAQHGHTVAYFTLEDDREELVERLWCHVGSVDNQDLRRGIVPPISPELWRTFRNVKLLAMDGFGYTMPEIVQVIDQCEPTPSVLVVDYVQMIDDSGAESEYRAIAQFIRELKVFAEQTKIAALVCSQINRQGATEGRPSLHHLARCGRLEEVANLVGLLYWPFGTHGASYDYSTSPPLGFAPGDCPSDYFELEIAKNKTGPKGVVPLRFIGPHYRFEAWEERDGR